MAHRCIALALLGLSFWMAPRSLAQDVSPLSLRLQLDAGAGGHNSTLSGVNGTRRFEPAWFPMLGFRVVGLQATGKPLRFGAELTYVSGAAFDVTSASATGAARAQELLLLARMAIGLGPIALPISLGYSFDAFTTNVPLTGAQAYLLSGPRAALGIEVPLWAARLNLAARAELGANVTETAGLSSAGVNRFGVMYAFQVEADVQLTEFLSLGVRARQAEIAQPASDQTSFHEQRRMLLASVLLRNPS